MGSLHGNRKRNFALALTLGEEVLALNIAYSQKKRDARPDTPAREALPREIAFERILSYKQIVPGETGYAVLRMGNGAAKESTPQGIEQFNKDLKDLIEQCESARVYTAVIRSPKNGTPSRVVLNKLNELRERGIEYAFHKGPEDFKTVLDGIHQTLHASWDKGFFKVTQRKNFYPKDVYIIELKDRSFENYKDLRPQLNFELHFIGAEIRNKCAIIMLPNTSIPVYPIRDIRKALEKFGIDCFFYFAKDMHLGIRHDHNSGNNYTNYVNAVSDAIKSVGFPKIPAPENGWLTINAPEYKAEGKFFYIRGLRNIEETTQKDFQRDLKSLREHSGIKLCFSTCEERISAGIFSDLYYQIAVPFSEENGELVIQHADKEFCNRINQNFNMKFASTVAEVRSYFEHSFPMHSPSGGFRCITKPMRFMKDSDILYSEFAGPSLINGVFSAQGKALAMEVRRVMSNNVEGLILNLENFKMEKSNYKNIAGQLRSYSAQQVALVSYDSNTYNELRTIGSIKLPVYRTLDEAWLAARYNVLPPEDGWRLFQPRVTNPEEPIIVLEVPKVGIGHSFMTKEIPVAYYDELESLRKSGLPVILDITCHEEVGSSAKRAFMYMETQIGEKSKFVIASSALYGASDRGLPQIYSSYASAMLNVLKSERSPVGI